MSLLSFLCALVALLLGPLAQAQVANGARLDVRDPLVLPYPAVLEASDIFIAWQGEIHFDKSQITISDGTQRSTSPSAPTNAITLGFKFTEDFSFQVQALLAFRHQAGQFHGQFDIHSADEEFPLDFAAGAGLGYSAKGGLLPEAQLVFGRTFRPEPQTEAKGRPLVSRGIAWTPRLVHSFRVLGHAFSEAAFDGVPHGPYAGATRRVLVYETLVQIEAHWRGFVARLGGGWTQLIRTFRKTEDTPGANFGHERGPMIYFSIGASFSAEEI